MTDPCGEYKNLGCKYKSMMGECINPMHAMNLLYRAYLNRPKDSLLYTQETFESFVSSWAEAYLIEPEYDICLASLRGEM